MNSDTPKELEFLEMCKATLAEFIGDDEAYHSKFDELLEIRLEELDPEFMKAMTELYNKSKMARWCA